MNKKKADSKLEPALPELLPKLQNAVCLIDLLFCFGSLTFEAVNQTMVNGGWISLQISTPCTARTNVLAGWGGKEGSATATALLFLCPFRLPLASEFGLHAAVRVPINNLRISHLPPPWATRAKVRSPYERLISLECMPWVRLFMLGGFIHPSMNINSKAYCPWWQDRLLVKRLAVVALAALALIGAICSRTCLSVHVKTRDVELHLEYEK